MRMKWRSPATTTSRLFIWTSFLFLLTDDSWRTTTTTTTTTFCSAEDISSDDDASYNNNNEWNFTYSDLKACRHHAAAASNSNTTPPVFLVSSEEEEEEEFKLPCIEFLIEPPVDEQYANVTSVITLVQVTPLGRGCDQSRHGPVTGVNVINQDNDGKGAAIGFRLDHFIKFRLISIVVGDTEVVERDVYDKRHTSLLQSAVQYWKPEFIVGTCSLEAHKEKQVALEVETMLLAPVGPPSFYRDNNPWLFGIHVSSDEYSRDATRRLKFWATAENRQPSTIPVRVIYRHQSEFFFSTCQQALKDLDHLGFTDVMDIMYDAGGDDDGDGIPNGQDVDFMNDVIDQACPPNSSSAGLLPGGGGGGGDFHPAFFFCTNTGELTLQLERLRQNGCTPSSIWSVASTWKWAYDNPELVPYFQGAGQWHPSMGYSDKYFGSGVELLDFNEGEFGYRGGYDMVVGYSIPVLISDYFISVYRTADRPEPLADMQQQRETLRRQMINLKSDSLFGPIAFDANQRNRGREAAASQWLPIEQQNNTNFNNNNEAGTSGGRDALTIAMVSPISFADAAAVLPAVSAVRCGPGLFVDQNRIAMDPAVLDTKCSPCPIDTFLAESSFALECIPCPGRSTTEGGVGGMACTVYEDNLLSKAQIGFGGTTVAFTWILAVGFLFWAYSFRKDPVVQMAQLEYLILICLGTMVSSSALIGLSFQAGHDEDTSLASMGCKALPFLYTIGWVLQYGSLSAKTYRLSQIIVPFGRTTSSTPQRRAKAPKWTGIAIVLVSMGIDLIVTTTWALVSPLEYIREVSSVALEDGVVVVESSGGCRMSTDDTSIWAFTIPIMAHHIILMAGTHYLLDRVSTVNHRYQEKRYIGMASIIMLEVALIGIPVLVAAGESVELTYIILTFIVTLDNVGVLCLIFIPKIYFQRKGLDAGIGVGESILQETHDNARMRERMKTSVWSSMFFSSRPEAWGTKEFLQAFKSKGKKGAGNDNNNERPVGGERDEASTPDGEIHSPPHFTKKADGEILADEGDGLGTPSTTCRPSSHSGISMDKKPILSQKSNNEGLGRGRSTRSSAPSSQLWSMATSETVEA